MLMIRRSKEPDMNRWSFPGGKVEFGEGIVAAVLRELSEETSIVAKVEAILPAVEAIDENQTGAIKHHFVIVPVLCNWVSGEPVAGDDANDAGWFSPAEASKLELATGFDIPAMVRSAISAVPQRNCA
ncbi:hypothetical protein GCM10010862_10790 [Devosia nitrariae]|uniref:Nudix hydrolase domain-containing protein n=2 Tax=Devosia nitrariae TaxID=2071872 RepID=A0ABQ5W1N5_9HYPH|nr:hypothetical protein GCM10010862_10790 [Devosia nitrariae]